MRQPGSKDDETTFFLFPFYGLFIKYSRGEYNDGFPYECQIQTDPFFAKKETKPVNYDRAAVILLVTHT